jgi:selenium metabolism protein YedF
MQSENRYALMVTRRVLGGGNDELGWLLMVKFLRSLETAPALPETVILINGGIHLALDDSPVLEILQRLAARGVTVRACGTCLDFYGVRERLAVGEIGTMDQAATVLAEAGRTVVV